jgi:hypothetical protein
VPIPHKKPQISAQRAPEIKPAFSAGFVMAKDLLKFPF